MLKLLDEKGFLDDSLLEGAVPATVVASAFYVRAKNLTARTCSHVCGSGSSVIISILQK